VLIGNSSAGILEAASFRLPAVNVGERQTGRVRPANVIDTPIDRPQIAAAVRKAMDPRFRDGLADLVNPYGDGRAAERILSVLRDLPARRTLLVKRWADPA
jgi:UDP-N-acetylglucosamine 2-epimerase